MTTNFSWSNARCRSISGRVPLPIEPKPIITIGPSNRASRPSGVRAVTSVTPKARDGLSRRTRRQWALVADEVRDEAREVRPGRRWPAGADQAARAVERSGRELIAEQPVA